MGVFFHILSTGGDSGASRITRYIAERDKNLEREGPGSRRLFSEDQDNLSYHRADRILDPRQGQPDKDDLIHFSVMIEEEEFDKLGKDEQEKQAHFREAVREAMKGMAVELNVAELTWVGGIHRNSQNPHVHVVMNKEALDIRTGKPRRMSRIPKRLLPHKETRNGRESIVNGPIGERFLESLEKQQALYLDQNRREPELTGAEKWEQLARKYQKEYSLRTRETERRDRSGEVTSRDHSQVANSWKASRQVKTDKTIDFRIALGKRLEFEMRLAFAEVWHDRAIQRGDTYRFEVVDQTTGEERRISDLDVRRRAAARASRVAIDRVTCNEAIEADLAQHDVTLQQLSEAREAKIDALGKDVGSLSSILGKLEADFSKRYEMPAEKELVPLISRDTLSELQQQAVKLNLPERVAELEKVRIALAHEHDAPARTDDETATLAAQLNVARADAKSGDARLDNFEAAAHLTTYEVAGERWSLAAIDKQITRRRDDSRLVPDRAARLDLRSLARLNYSPRDREHAVADVERLSSMRTEIVREIEKRRTPLIADRDLSREMFETLEQSYSIEEKTRARSGTPMPEPTLEAYQINRLEASAEILRDSELLRAVDEREKTAARSNSETHWEGRAVAREIMSEIAVRETKGRLEHFLESQRVTSLNLGDHRTGTLREVEARTLTDYVARAIESNQQTEHRHAIKNAAREHYRHLVNDFEKAKSYFATARELASGAEGHDPEFTDREKANLEIYAERQNDEMTRDQFLQLARTESHTRQLEGAETRSR